jgi:hypothetical protein
VLGVWCLFSLWLWWTTKIVFTPCILNGSTKPILLSTTKSLPCDIYLEPATQVYLLGHVALSAGNNRQSAVIDGESQTSPTRDFPYLKLSTLSVRDNQRWSQTLWHVCKHFLWTAGRDGDAKSSRLP